MNGFKRSFGSVVGISLYIFSIACPFFFLIREILQSGSFIWLLPFLIYVFVLAVITYKSLPSSIFGNFIRGEPLLIDRSDEVYQFNKPYTAKKD